MNNTLSITPEAAEAMAERLLFEQLRAARIEIARLRRHNCNLTAGIMRDEMMSLLEAWINPAGLTHRAELQAIQGRAAVALALAIDDKIGF